MGRSSRWLHLPVAPCKSPVNCRLRRQQYIFRCSIIKQLTPVPEVLGGRISTFFSYWRRLCAQNSHCNSPSLLLISQILFFPQSGYSLQNMERPYWSSTENFISFEGRVSEQFEEAAILTPKPPPSRDSHAWFFLGRPPILNHSDPTGHPWALKALSSFNETFPRNLPVQTDRQIGRQGYALLYY